MRRDCDSFSNCSFYFPGLSHYDCCVVCRYLQYLLVHRGGRHLHLPNLLVHPSLWIMRLGCYSIYCWLNHGIFLKFCLSIISVSFVQIFFVWCTWNCCLQNVCHFVHASMCHTIEKIIPSFKSILRAVWVCYWILFCNNTNRRQTKVTLVTICLKPVLLLWTTRAAELADCVKNLSGVCVIADDVFLLLRWLKFRDNSDWHSSCFFFLMYQDLFQYQYLLIFKDKMLMENPTSLNWAFSGHGK